jgi:hypothetical protein
MNAKKHEPANCAVGGRLLLLYNSAQTTALTAHIYMNYEPEE